MTTVADVILISALAGVWLAAGLLAESLPTAPTALLLRRRAVLLSTVIFLGAVAFVAIPLVAWLVPGPSEAPAAAMLAAVPALFALTVTNRRLGRVRLGAGAFATAPQTPVPPALRAAAAHPLITTPLQVTGLAALVGLPIAAGLIRVPGTGVTAVAATVVGLAVVVIGVRAAVRHSRLNLQAFAPFPTRRRLRVR